MKYSFLIVLIASVRIMCFANHDKKNSISNSHANESNANVDNKVISNKMKKHLFKIKNIITALCIISFAACSSTSLQNHFTPVVDIQIPEQTPKLVLIGRILAGVDSIELFVTKSRGALDTALLYNNRYDTVTTAIVKVFKDNVLYATPQYIGSGKYVAKLPKAVPYDRAFYTVQVIAPNFVSIEATQQMVSPARIDSVSFVERVKVSQPLNDIFDILADQRDASQFTLYFKDTPNEVNYYTAIGIAQLPNQSTIFNLRCDSRDPASENNYLNAKNLDGKNISWSTHSRALIGRQHGGGPNQNGGGNGMVQSGTQIWISLTSVSVDRYLFEQSYSIYQNALNNPFAEPVILHNNIKNGFGIFTTAAQTTYSFKL